MKRLLLLLGFIIFMTDGGRMVIPDANAVLFKDGGAYFIRVVGGEVNPIVMIPLNKLGIIVEMPGRVA